MANRVLTGYQVGLGVLCALGLAVAIWLTSTDPTVSYSAPGANRTVDVTCSAANDLLRPDEKPPRPHSRTYMVSAECASAERARLRTIVWVLAGVLAVGLVLMGTVIVRLGRRRR